MSDQPGADFEVVERGTGAEPVRALVDGEGYLRGTIRLSDADAGAYTPPPGLTLAPKGASVPLPPASPPPVPPEVTMFQARAVLLQTPGSPGPTLFHDVDAAMQAGKTASPEGLLAWQAWEYANTMFRDGLLVQSMAATLGLDAPALDDLFRAAAQVTI